MENDKEHGQSTWKSDGNYYLGFRGQEHGKSNGNYFSFVENGEPN